MNHIEPTMDNACSETLLRLINKSKRKAMGRISQKELKGSLLIIALFKEFDIKNKEDPAASEGKVRSRVQELIGNNTIAPSGAFHFTDFFDEDFIKDIDKEFILKKKTS